MGVLKHNRTASQEALVYLAGWQMSQQKFQVGVMTLSFLLLWTGWSDN